MSPPSAAAAQWGKKNNPYTMAFHREPGDNRKLQAEKEAKELAYVIPRNRKRTTRQSNKILRAQQYSSHEAVERMNGLNRGAEKFLEASTPTIGDLIEHTQQRHTQNTRLTDKYVPISEVLERARVNREASESVRREYANTESKGVYGNIPRIKPDNSIRLMYENFSSLSVFSTGAMRHKKIRQINKLIADYGVDILAGCETRTDWRFVESEEDRYCNLFGNGLPTKGVFGQNTNDEKMKRDQWGGTCISSFGRLSSFVMATGVDPTSLGRWSWIRVGGGGKTTRVIVAYQPVRPNKSTSGGTVWDQHVRYFEARGEIRNPRAMFQSDLLSQLRMWKEAGDETLLFGDFNEDVYTGQTALSLSGEFLRMKEICKLTTGIPLPPTHNRGTIPIDAVFGTAGLAVTSVALLPSRTGVGDHRVFLIDVSSDSIMGDVFPRVMPATCRLLNCESDKIKTNYIKVLKQLSNRHQIFKKLLVVDRESNGISSSSIQLKMNKIDLELEQFMKSSEQHCHKYKRTHIEWSPYAGVWLHRRWLLVRVERYLSGKIRDPRNLFRECRRRGVKDPRQITRDELKTEFFVCRQNLIALAKNGPYFRRKFLQGLCKEAKLKGEINRAGKICGILQKESSRKRWRRVNRSTRKARGGLTVAVKVPTTDVEEGFHEYKTQEGVFQAVSSTLVERFQSALIAPCHRGKFFEDVGHLADGPVAQQILEGTYEYPQDLDPATRLLFEEATATYAALSPTAIATYVTPEDFQHFWQTARERTGSSYSGLHFGHYKAASFCPDLSLIHAAKLTICARNGVALARWGTGLTVLLEKILGNVFVHKLRAICLLEADFNWWNKLIFAKRMMKQAGHMGCIPQECFAKKHSHCNYAVLTKQFFCDSSRSLHYPAGLGECDFGDCYDRAAHPPTSIALQSWGIPASAIRILLTSMQTMQYVLKTGFGESTETYGGTSTSPNSGLGQGSGASPPGFMALSSLIVNAYRRMGHGAKILSSYSARVFFLAAVMYVDDTDLLHWPPSITTDPEELVQYVQHATTDWGKLAQASGGILKAGKCSVYFLDYKFVRGRAKMKSLQDLPEPARLIDLEGKLMPSHISIPQPDGTKAYIVTHDVGTASKVLGVHFTPAGNSTAHVESCVQKGLDWVDCIHTRPLTRSDTWLSFQLQLFPAMSWGLVTVCLQPMKLDAMIQKVYAKALPHLGVNRNIKKEWRTLPERYQGLALPNFPLIALSEKVSFILENWGFHGQAHSDGLALAYENFLVEVGLYDNPFQWSYKDYGHLSTDSTWFKNLWQLLYIFQAELQIQECDQISGIRVGDRSLVAEFFRLGYRSKDLESLNIVRRCRNLIHVSDIVRCDGKTIDEFITSDSTELSEAHIFPREQPTESDFRLWKEAITKLCLGTTSLPYSLGNYLRKPHLPWSWYTTANADCLYHERSGNPPSHDIYRRRGTGVGTRYGKKYDWMRTQPGRHTGNCYASVTMSNATCAILHSTAKVPVVVPSPSSFLETLQSFGNGCLWDNLSVDCDGEWIGQAVRKGSLSIAHDGSYMQETSTIICSAGVVMYCKISRCWLKLSIAEKSDAASNYRGELLGAVMTLLILRAAMATKDTVTRAQQVILCDNRGVISHGNSPHQSLPEKQKQADLIRLMKLLSSTNKFHPKWEWVEGHAVERKGWRCSTLAERLNHQADILAKDSLVSAIAGGSVMEGDFPFEPTRFKLSGIRVCTSPRQSLEKDWGYRTARTLYAEKDIIQIEDFHLVWWDGLDRAMAGYPKSYRVWLTKHVSEFCGNNVQLYYWSKGRQSPKCEFCRIEDEYTMHICRCKDPGRDSMFNITVKDLCEWLEKTLRERYISETVKMYLLARGETLMIDCVHGVNPDLMEVARESDRLGWDSFLEGRITSSWLPMVLPMLLTSLHPLLPPSWGRQFINRLHNIVHKQWIYRNTCIHYRGTDGFTLQEQDQIINRVEEYSLIDPEDLLPRHQYLLDTDFEALGSGTTIDRQIWLANFDSARSAALLSQAGTLTPDAVTYYSTK